MAPWLQVLAANPEDFSSIPGAYMAANKQLSWPVLWPPRVCCAPLCVCTHIDKVRKNKFKEYFKFKNKQKQNTVRIEVGFFISLILVFLLRQGLSKYLWLSWNPYVDQTGLKLTEIHLTLPSELGLNVCYHTGLTKRVLVLFNLYKKNQWLSHIQ